MNDIKKLDAKKYPDITDAIANIKKWNHKATLDNTDIAIYYYAFNYMLDDAFKRFQTYDIDAVAREDMFVKNIRKAKAFLLKKLRIRVIMVYSTGKQGNRETRISLFPYHSIYRYAVCRSADQYTVG